ncbi:uncharacterized protein LOC120440238 [Oreochromis aureus]|uniref:uncharacterized protein LOC120440238 n=1 Tax=Oreochromis aureus TaxID=47969 RepID=UPI0019535A44|nr:uncharacterized protein LOC120440238 [Oreochromis aureus]
MELSLKYGFVTPLTSMVVTKPPGENTDVLHKPKEGETSQRSDVMLEYLTPDTGQLSFALSAADFDPKIRSHRYIMSYYYAAPLLHKFLLNSTGNQTVPLCFDISGAIILKLFHHPSRDLSVNGELDSIANGGFSKIFIHIKTHQHVEVDAESQRVTVRDGQAVTYQAAGQDPSTVGSVTVTVYNTEIHIAPEDILLVISQHEKNGQRLLWPVLRQQPSTNNTEGLLAVKPAVYEVVQQVPVTKLKIKNQETDVTRYIFVMFSVSSFKT